MGPIWGVGLILDRNLVVTLTVANIIFAVAFVWLSFRGRPAIDRLFIMIGLFVTLTIASLAGMHLFARTPVRDAQFFSVD